MSDQIEIKSPDDLFDYFWNPIYEKFKDQKTWIELSAMKAHFQWGWTNAIMAMGLLQQASVPSETLEDRGRR